MEFSSSIVTKDNLPFFIRKHQCHFFQSQSSRRGKWWLKMFTHTNTFAVRVDVHLPVLKPPFRLMIYFHPSARLGPPKGEWNLQRLGEPLDIIFEAGSASSRKSRLRPRRWRRNDGATDYLAISGTTGDIVVLGGGGSLVVMLMCVLSTTTRVQGFEATKQSFAKIDSPQGL